MDPSRRSMRDQANRRLLQLRGEAGVTQAELHRLVRAEAWAAGGGGQGGPPRGFDPFPLRTVRRYEGAEGGSEPPAAYVELVQRALGTSVEITEGNRWARAANASLIRESVRADREARLATLFRLDRTIPQAVLERVSGLPFAPPGHEDGKRVIRLSWGPLGMFIGWIAAAALVGERAERLEDYRADHGTVFRAIEELPDHDLESFLLHLIEAGKALARPSAFDHGTEPTEESDVPS